MSFHGWKIANSAGSSIDPRHTSSIEQREDRLWRIEEFAQDAIPRLDKVDPG
jgi:hypothetical protein